jgi:hypothetical protein
MHGEGDDTLRAADRREVMRASQVPSYLSVGGVDFALDASHLGVGLEESVEELEALRYAIDEMVNGDSWDVPIGTLARKGFHVQELSALPIMPGCPLGNLGDGPINWRRLSDSWPDLGDAFIVRAGFISRELVVPRPVLIELIMRLRALRDEVLQGKREGRVDDAKVPPLRPLTPELEEHELLRRKSYERAQAYREERYARRR